MWKLSQGLLYAILIVLTASGAYARGGTLHLFVPTTKPNTELPEDWKGGHGLTIRQVLPYASGMPTKHFELTQEKGALDHGNDRGHGTDLEISVPFASPNRYFTGPSVEWQEAISVR